MGTYKQLTLAKRPDGPIESDTFKLEIHQIPKASDLKDNEVLIKVLYLSVDPAMRGWLRDTRSYIEPVQIGAVMRAYGLGSIVARGSKVTNLKVGDTIEGLVGWAEYAVLPTKGLVKRSPPVGAQLTDYLAVLGAPGQTAYWGILDVGKIKAGEKVVVSGAAGAVGSAVCQIAKIKGCKVYAIAGGDDKCKWLESELGVDKAINYKAKDFAEQVKKLGYVDCYFDNVGSDMLELLLTRMNPHGRIVMCGAIADYNAKKPKGLSTYLNIISQRLEVRGFIVFDYAKRYREAEEEMARWIAEGKLKRKETIVYGLEKAPQALNGLFEGQNTGKMIVEVFQDRAKL